MDPQKTGATEARKMNKIDSQEIILGELIWDAPKKVGVYISEYQNIPVAVKKFIAKPDSTIIDPTLEGQMQFSAAHPNIVTLYGYIQDAAYNGLVMELCAGSMGDFLEYKDLKGTEAMRDSMIIDVAEGLVYLHEVCHILHLDIKHDNILLVENRENEYTAKIADFGLSKRLDPGADKYYLNSSLGTTRWAAPEAYKYDPKNNGMIYSTKTDIWGLGLLIHLLTRDRVIEPLPETYDIPQIVNGMVSNMPLDETYSNAPTRTLIRQCLTVSANDRASSKQVLLKLEENKTLFRPKTGPQPQ